MQCQVLSERRDQDGAGALLAGRHGKIGLVHLGIRAGHLPHTLKVSIIIFIIVSIITFIIVSIIIFIIISTIIISFHREIWLVPVKVGACVNVTSICIIL